MNPRRKDKFSLEFLRHSAYYTRSVRKIIKFTGNTENKFYTIKPRISGKCSKFNFIGYNKKYLSNESPNVSGNYNRMVKYKIWIV